MCKLNYFTENILKHEFQSIFRISLPWNQHKNIGYFYELIAAYITAMCYVLVSGFMFIVFIAVCLFHPAFYKKIKHLLGKLDEPNKNQNNTELLCNIIKFYIVAKE